MSHDHELSLLNGYDMASDEAQDVCSTGSRLARAQRINEMQTQEKTHYTPKREEHISLFSCVADGNAPAKLAQLIREYHAQRQGSGGVSTAQ